MMLSLWLSGLAADLDQVDLDEAPAHGQLHLAGVELDSEVDPAPEAELERPAGELGDDLGLGGHRRADRGARIQAVVEEREQALHDGLGSERRRGRVVAGVQEDAEEPLAVAAVLGDGNPIGQRDAEVARGRDALGRLEPAAEVDIRALRGSVPGDR